MITRATSLYVLTVPAYVNGLLDAMVEVADSNPDIQRAGAWNRGDKVILMFRASNDQVAIAASEQMGGNTLGSLLHTGLGVHRRDVAKS